MSAHQPVVDPGRDPDVGVARRARAALDEGVDVDAWAARFALLSDPGRLRLLFCLHRAPGIRVGDLAAAVSMSDTSVSHALRLLRSNGWVTSRRDGRTIRYELADDTVHDLLHRLGAHHPQGVGAPTAPGSPVGSSS